MMARTVDKLRATLPGGKLGDYALKGFSQRLLEHLGIKQSDLFAVVAVAAGDDDVAAWLRKHTDRARYAEINDYFANRKIGDVGDREAFEAKYPVAKGLPDDALLIDMLERDDAAAFAKR
jgi:hypothetical protein